VSGVQAVGAHGVDFFTADGTNRDWEPAAAEASRAAFA